MIGFPIDELLSEEECYRYLKRSLHPEGLSRPNGYELPSDQAPHDRRRAPIVDYRCRECGAVFNIWYGVVENALRPFDHHDASPRICKGGSPQAAHRRDGSGLSVGAGYRIVLAERVLLAGEAPLGGCSRSHLVLHIQCRFS